MPDHIAWVEVDAAGRDIPACECGWRFSQTVNESQSAYLIASAHAETANATTDGTDGPAIAEPERDADAIKRVLMAEWGRINGPLLGLAYDDLFAALARAVVAAGHSLPPAVSGETAERAREEAACLIGEAIIAGRQALLDSLHGSTYSVMTAADELLAKLIPLLAALRAQPDTT